MKYFIKKTIITFLFLVSIQNIYAQQKPFWDEIQNFKKQDSIHPVPKNAILFVGSSSFRKWTDVQSYFPGYKIINRGFGGSTLPDVIAYANEIILPYNAKQIVIYCGENDFAVSDSVSASLVFMRFKVLYNLIRKKFPNVTIDFISIKPSPSRQKLIPKMATANEMIKKFLANKPNTGFIDVYHKMLKPDGMPMDDIFLEDKLHMTAKGYKIWQKEIQLYLLK